MSAAPNPFKNIDAEALMLSDRPALERASRAAPAQKKAAGLQKRLNASMARAARRASLKLDCSLPADLPISAEAARIREALAANQVVVVCGATGSGKTTQLPKLCVEAGRGIVGTVGHTQPRRLAARAVAERVADEMGTSLGDGVGFRVRFDDKVSADSRVVVMTDGILLQELKRDPSLLAYDTLILDEAHERSLNIDFLLGVIKNLLPRRPELKLIVTSATIDPQRFADYFGGAPVIEVGGRGYPIEMRYHEDPDAALSQRVLDAVQRLLPETPPSKDNADVLVFLPGERDIRDADRALRGAGLARQLEILPLYARLSSARQQRVFRPGAKRRVVLSTNVAETSLTVPRIGFVIDSGLARVGRYSHRSKMQRLPIEPVSMASLNQRAGRCGRLGPGVCVRLFAEEDLAALPEFESPQIQRSNLAGVILQMAHLGLGRIDDFDFMDPPQDGLVRDGYTLLRELGALTEDDRITSVGRGMAGLPLEPRLARALLAAQRFHCLEEALIVVSALAVPDPMERSDDAPAAFVDRRSDWSTRLNLWRVLQEQGGASRQRAWCRDNGINFVRVLEWKDVQRQLRRVCRERRLQANDKPATSAALHRALLAGFVSHIGQRHEGREYRGARGRRFSIFPGSPVSAGPPPWIVATEMIETSRVFGHQVAAVTPAWIVEAAGHLVRREPVDPAWSASRGRATARQRAVVFGLSIELPKRVPLAPMDPAGARALAIEHLLVHPPDEGPLAKIRFHKHNRQRIADARAMERRVRRLLVDDAALFRFFDARVPRDVVDLRALLQWHENASETELAALQLDWSDVGLDSAPSMRRYPTSFHIGRNKLRLTYRFAPGEPDDGVTLRLPHALLDQLDPDAVEWLVPGWLEGKVTRLLRGLPKAQRKKLAPMQQTAQAFLAEALAESTDPDGAQSDLNEKGSLRAALAAFASRRVGEPVGASAFDQVELDPFLRARVVVVDESGVQQNATRDVAQLCRGLRSRVKPVAIRGGAGADWHRDDIRSWDMGEMPRTVRVRQGGVELVGRPALVVREDQVMLRVYADTQHADTLHADGVGQLVLAQLKDKRRYLRKQLSDANALSLLYGALGPADRLFDDLALCAVRALAPVPLAQVRDEAAFGALLDASRRGVIAGAESLARDALAILSGRRDVLARLTPALERAHPAVFQDIEAQVGALVPADVLRSTPAEWRGQIPRFLSAIERRLDKLSQRGNESPALLSDVQAREQRLASVEDAALRARLETYRWMLQEYRVSLFSQPMKTSRPVSAKRLEAAWEQALGG